MKRVFVSLMVVFIILLCGCQPTPEEEVVVAKNDLEEILESQKNIEDVILTQGDGDSFSNYNAPEHWEDSVEKNGVSISIDADVSLPSEGGISVTKYEPLIYSQDDTNNFVQYFADDNKLYIYPTALTKEDYQQELIEVKRGSLIDGEYVVTEESLECVEEIEKLIETAPDESGKQYTDSTLTYDIEDNIDTDSPNSVIEGGKNFLKVAIENGNNDDAQLSIRNFVSGYNAATKLYYSTGSSVITESYLNSGNVSFSEEGRKEQYQKMIRDLNNAVDDTQAQIQAEQLLSDLNIIGMATVNTEKAILQSLANYDGISSNRQPVAGWYFTYMRTVNRLSCIDDVNAYLGETDNSVDYAAPVTIEKVQVFVSIDGVQSFRYNGALVQIETVSENVTLLDFDEIQTRAKNQIYYSNAYEEDSSVSTKVSISNIELRLAYIKALNSDNELLLIPVWCFTGTVDMYSGGELMATNETAMMLSAIDGGTIQFQK